MRKSLIFAGMLTSIVATAQDYDKRVGINTTEPRATLEVSATNSGKAEGILYPHISETEKNDWKKDGKKGLVAGTMIWNLNKICLDYFDGTIWQCTDGTKKNTHGTPWTIYSELAVASLGFNGTFKQGTSLSGSTVKFKLTNRSGFALNNLDLTDAVSVVNNGASITAVGQNANNISISNGESVEITYNLSGTPNTGDLVATFTYQGQSVSAQTTVASKTTAEIMQNVSVMVGTPAGTYKDGTALTNSNTVSVTLTNNSDVALSNADLRNALSITNTGATITATASANANPVTLAPSQSITLTYTLSGTPKEGTLTANFSYAGKEASNYTTVAEQTASYPTTGTLTVSAEGKHTIFSMYDNNYFPYTAPASTAVASWETNVAPTGDTTNETLIDIQGKIPAAGLIVKIPITYSGSNTTLPAYTSKAVAIDPKGEQDVTNSTRKLILSWEQQTITSSTTYITAKITPADGQVLNVTKLDLNAGFDKNFDGPILASFSLPKSNTNMTTKVSYTIRVIPGIPDRNFGQTNKEHDFIYLPVIAEDGKIWLNNNLGADYAKYGGDYFDPAQQATSRNDWKAYGSLFQWQRKADGHELMVHSASSTSVKNTGLGSVVSTWDAGTENRFIPYNSSSGYSWTTATSPLDLWQSNQSNNPCPVGFHVPTDTEWSNLQIKSGGSQNYDWWAGTSKLRLPAAGYRYRNNGTPNQQGIAGTYWGSSPYPGSPTSSAFGFNSSVSNPSSDSRAYGFSVRCIAD